MAPTLGNDHAVIPGDEKVDAIYKEYGPFFKRMRGSRWLLEGALKAECADERSAPNGTGQVSTQAVPANAFTVNDAVRIVVANIGLGNCSHVAVTIYSSKLDPNRCTAFFLDGTAKHAAPMGSAQPHRWVFAPLPLHRGLAFLAC